MPLELTHRQARNGISARENAEGLQTISVLSLRTSGNGVGPNRRTGTSCSVSRINYLATGAFDKIQERK
jgi:hypothetical protein